MEFFINDPNIPRSTPSATRLVDLRAKLDRERKRLKVTLELSPFQQGPNIDISLTDSSGIEVASTSIIEPVSWKLELTLHIRKFALTTGEYTLAARLFYTELGEVDRRNVIIEIPNFDKVK